MFFKTINAFPDMNAAVDHELMYVDQAMHFIADNAPKAEKCKLSKHSHMKHR